MHFSPAHRRVSAEHHELNCKRRHGFHAPHGSYVARPFVSLFLPQWIEDPAGQMDLDFPMSELDLKEASRSLREQLSTFPGRPWQV